MRRRPAPPVCPGAPLAAPLLLLLALAGPTRAGEADVEAIEVRCSGPSVCTFHVSVRHADEGWEHFANRWEIVGPDGEVLATRVLQHPHVDEQPFTRSLPDVAIPEGLSEVTVRAHDSVHGVGGRTGTARIPALDRR
ncbi:MAG: hypothetical protein ACYTAF_13425 [Planctomycetota bacterium]